MALREEFEYIAFRLGVFKYEDRCLQQFYLLPRCCYCYYWNPARKQRPVAPRLVAAAEKPAPSSESSGSDESAPNSVPGSRRASESKTELKHEEVKAIGDSAFQAGDESPEESEKKANVSPEPEQGETKSEIEEEVSTEHQEETKTEEPSQSDNETESNTEVGDSGFEHIKLSEEVVTTSDSQSKLNTDSKDSNENQMDIDS